MYDLPITSVILSVLMRAFPMIPALVHEMSPLLERGYVWERWVYRPNSRRSSVKKTNKQKNNNDRWWNILGTVWRKHSWPIWLIAVIVSSKINMTAVFLQLFSFKVPWFLGPFPSLNYKWHQWPSKALVSNIIDFYNM